MGGNLSLGVLLFWAGNQCPWRVSIMIRSSSALLCTWRAIHGEDVDVNKYSKGLLVQEGGKDRGDYTHFAESRVYGWFLWKYYNFQDSPTIPFPTRRRVHR